MDLLAILLERFVCQHDDFRPRILAVRGCKGCLTPDYSEFDILIFISLEYYTPDNFPRIGWSRWRWYRQFRLGYHIRNRRTRK